MAAELLTRQFTSEIQPLLYPSFGFLSRAINDDAFVNNNTVELPHSGTIPAVQVDRSSLPATIAKRTDAATQYTLEELTTDPTLLQDSEALTVAYDKRQSILMQHAEEIRKKYTARALYNWAGGATTFIPTTGTARAATGASQTGNRNAVTKADWLEVKRRFHADDVIPDNSPVNGIAVITPSMMNDILNISEFTDAEKFGTPGLPQGVVTRIAGFDVYVRSSVVVTTNADALKAEGAAAAATDQDAALFYSPQYVRRAVGAYNAYVDIGKPEYYGDIFSSMLRFGATYARNDNKGVYLMFEDTNP
jgi:hypothetical protein